MEENKEKFYTKLSHYGMTKKTLYSVVSIIACMALIIIISIVQAEFDATQLKTISYWVNFILLCGICIFGMITGQQIGDDMSRNNKSGSFRMALKKYSVIYEKIDSNKYFAYIEDWLEIFRERKLNKKIRDTLKDNGVFQLEVLDLDKTEINNLLNPWKKDWTGTNFYDKYFNEKTGNSETYFMSYTEEQIEIIRKCLEGKIKVSELPKSFFVSVYNQSGSDIWESAAKSEKKKGTYLGASYIYKIISLLAFQIVLTGLQVGTGGASSSAVWLSLISRLSTMVMSIFWGVYIGFEIVKIDVVYLEFKTDVLSQYNNEIEEGLYKPKTIEEKAKEKYEEEMKREVNVNEQKAVLG